MKADEYRDNNLLEHYLTVLGGLARDTRILAGLPVRPSRMVDYVWASNAEPAQIVLVFHDYGYAICDPEVVPLGTMQAYISENPHAPRTKAAIESWMWQARRQEREVRRPSASGDVTR